VFDSLLPTNGGRAPAERSPCLGARRPAPPCGLTIPGTAGPQHGLGRPKRCVGYDGLLPVPPLRILSPGAPESVEGVRGSAAAFRNCGSLALPVDATRVWGLPLLRASPRTADYAGNCAADIPTRGRLRDRGIGAAKRDPQWNWLQISLAVCHPARWPNAAKQQALHTVVNGFAREERTRPLDE
jgi:hypothetical protein